MELTDHISRTLAEFRFIPRLTPTGMTSDRIDLSAKLTKDKDEYEGLTLKLPVVSAAMQSVTGPDMSVALAQQGGMGVIFCSQNIEDEAKMIKAVKRARAGFVSNLEVVNPTTTLREVSDMISSTGYNTIPVVDGNKDKYGRLLGLIEGPIPINLPSSVKSEEFMRKFIQRPLEDIVHELRAENSEDQDIIRAVNDYVYHGESNITLDEANEILEEFYQKFIPIVNKDGTLKFMVFHKDLKAHQDFPDSVLDPGKRYLVGAAVNTHDYETRVPAVVEAGADVIFIDSSDGYSEYMRDTIRFIKDNFKVPVVAGNVISDEAFLYLVESGADAVKLGMGGGSICITQEQKGTGRGQATATFVIAEARDKYHKKTGTYIPLISDGGIATGKDISVALAMGADLVMMGKYFATCHESPPELIEREGNMYKEYWGEGSSRAKEWLNKRYGQTEFEEGVVAYVPYAGHVDKNLKDLSAKIRATMTSMGALNIQHLREQSNGSLELISESSRDEGKVHDVTEIKQG
ncbi:IMP dehydrogenase [Candidatus Woesearchaeota archaeon]|nr:IMP dehydrogenase [Candidatus Woesearchaeota archaeon]